MTLNITVSKVSKPFKIVFMRANLKVADSVETDGSFTFPADFTVGEIIHCETWKVEGKQIQSEKLTFPDEDGNEVTLFPYDPKTILSIVEQLKQLGNNGLIVKAK